MVNCCPFSCGGIFEVSVSEENIFADAHIGEGLSELARDPDKPTAPRPRLYSVLPNLEDVVAFKIKPYAFFRRAICFPKIIHRVCMALLSPFGRAYPSIAFRICVPFSNLRFAYPYRLDVGLTPSSLLGGAVGGLFCIKCILMGG